MEILEKEEAVRTGFWPKLASVLARAPFAEHAVAAWYCAFDPATPLRAKGVLMASLAYFILPIDVIPDFILGIGFSDDAAVIIGAIGVIRAHLKPEHYDKAREALDRLKRGESVAV